jgi:superfamily II DNA/RNA helicase
VAARGIHVDDVAGVVHLDPPADEKDYIHRSGRTGRAGSRGVVVSFVAPEQRRDVAKMQRLLGMPTGTTSPDATGLPQGEARPVRRSRPRPTAAATPTGTSRPRRPRPVAGRDGAKPGRPARKPGPRPGAKSTTRSGPKSGPKAGGRSGPKSGPKAGAKSSSKLNRKARRAHLQPGAAGATSASKGHRRQPTVARAH